MTRATRKKLAFEMVGDVLWLPDLRIEGRLDGRRRRTGTGSCKKVPMAASRVSWEV